MTQVTEREVLDRLKTVIDPGNSKDIVSLGMVSGLIVRDGNVGFSHPWGTHDDVFWSIALAVYATADMGPEPFLAVIPRE